jgi:hypothetical protein
MIVTHSAIELCSILLPDRLSPTRHVGLPATVPSTAPVLSLCVVRSPRRTVGSLLHAGFALLFGPHDGSTPFHRGSLPIAPAPDGRIMKFLGFDSTRYRCPGACEADICTGDACERFAREVQGASGRCGEKSLLGSDPAGGSCDGGS